MKTNWILSKLLFCIIAIGINSCSKSGMESGLSELEDELALHIQGKITDETGSSVSGAIVNIKGQKLESGTDGNFRMDAGLKVDSVLLMVEKPGYFNYSQKFKTVGGGVLELDISLVKKPKAVTVSGNSGGVLKLENGLELVFPAQGIEFKQNRTTYNGMVKVYAKTFTSNQPNFETLIPGGETAKNESGENQIMSPSAFFMIELYDEKDQPLQIASGKAVEVRIKPSSETVLNPQEKMYSWHFNEKAAIWENKGEAIRVDTVFTFNATSFSSWAIGTRSDLGLIKIYLFKRDGTPFNESKVLITDVASHQRTYLYPDKNGISVTRFPINRDIAISTQDYCGNDISRSHRLFLTGKLYAYLSPQPTYKQEFVRLTGTAFGCNGSSPLLIGGIEIKQGLNVQYHSFKDGLFDIQYLKCRGPQFAGVSVKLMDFSGNKTHTIEAINQEGHPEINLGNVELCEPDTELSYAQINFGDSTYFLFENRDTFSIRKISPTSNGYEFTFKDMKGKYQMKFFVPEFYFGSYPLRQVLFFDGWDASSIYGGAALHSNPAELKFDEIGGVGERVSGSFSGQMREFSSQLILPMNGKFSFIRRN
ncbi:carboxypeptidase-like regulatory domain-containing protein [Flavihumibacter sp. UBA7668]|uniref:carboxypeptidase-like regulatory domain-containing protein n=1 Tax=Flavihumibacter sp. UBA7668 TaxID=1946542 RepID=UPI0025BBD799|nr:carboxypeptidase-like regulatory domain-containing protein [Flavihumibacter sp. UBA7668]